MAGNNEQDLRSAGVIKSGAQLEPAYKKAVDELTQGDVQALKRVYKKLQDAEAEVTTTDSSAVLTSKINF